MSAEPHIRCNGPRHVCTPCDHGWELRPWCQNCLHIEDQIVIDYEPYYITCGSCNTMQHSCCQDQFPQKYRRGMDTSGYICAECAQEQQRREEERESAPKAHPDSFV